MKFKKVIFSLAVLAAGICSCDDNTDTLGGSIIENLDNINVTSATFPIASKSVASGPVYSRSTTGYLGKIKDPETGAYIKGNFLTQFYTLEGTKLPEESSIQSKLNDGSLIADSCVIYLYYDNYFGDSLSTMKLKALELAKPMEEGKKYYSDFNPDTEGYLRKGTGSVSVNKTYSLYDLAADTMPKKIKVKLPNSKLDADGNILKYAYTDKDNKNYYNYGTYIMQKYYENPKLFKNSYTFIHKVCPGFYFESTDGLGSMANINLSQMLIYYRYKYEKESNGVKKDTTVNVVTTFAGTEEVIQASSVANDNDKIQNMVNDNSCTFIKSPAGIYTELTIPVDDILKGHENDTINSARISLTRINNSVNEKYSFSKPTTLMMVPKDSLKQFFEDEKLIDNKETYLAVYSESDNSSYGTVENAYTFHNIANLITFMNAIREKAVGEEPAKTSQEWNNWNAQREAWETAHPDWNKVLIVPVSTTYATVGQTSQLVKVSNDMSIAETRLVRGKETNSNITISVVYSKFEKR